MTTLHDEWLREQYAQEKSHDTGCRCHPCITGATAALKAPARPVLAFLQNMWVKEPERVKSAIARHGEEFRLQLMRRFLFAGCKTGRNLTKTFGDELLAHITFEETTREIAGDANTMFPVDRAHIRQCIEKQLLTLI